ncbi:uncharacterized protein LOC143298736 [Babylonia areolata]|uniref:uncharacterized protein LOC143298736 n=1 Tax=Babylonia areolata TaxID=304850 RepID=UPI003FD453C0
MASDDTLREAVRQNMAVWIQKLECGGDVEKQHHFKKRFLSRLRHSGIAEDTDKANEQHYEVPTDFFLTVLGSRLKYSCCYWPEGINTLDEAEEASLQKYCELSRLEDGHSVMDLGCGWGSFGLYVCEKFPRCRVTCVSNSGTQRQLIEARAQQRGFAERLQVITADANTFHTASRFDRIVSIEMFEHMKNYELLFQRVSTWLKPSGLLFLQVFCHRQHPYAFDVKPGSDTEWMAKNFFTGGTMPSMDLFLHFQRDLSLVESWVLSGQHYQRTLDAWLAKMDTNRDQVMEILQKAYGSDSEQQKFNWRLFFIFCSEVFGYKGGNEWHITYQLFRKNIPSAL